MVHPMRPLYAVSNNPMILTDTDFAARCLTNGFVVLPRPDVDSSDC